MQQGNENTNSNQVNAAATETAESFDKFIQSFGKKLEESFSKIGSLEFSYLAQEIQKLDVEATKVTKIFGQGRENIQNIKAAMADATASVVGLGGSYTDVTKIQETVAKDLSRNVILGGDVYKDIYAATQVTAQGAEKLIPAFKNVGVSAYGVSEGMQKIVDTARQQGLSVQAVSDMAVKNMTSMNQFNFQGGVEGLAKMAAQATSMRIDMKTTLDFAEKAFSPEGAIDMAAALQRLGVTQSDLLDPLRLMDLSMNDPTELQNQLVQMTEQFVQLNEKGQFEIAPQGKLQLREISKATGIAYDELTKMALGSSELEDKMRKIRFPDFMSEEQQKMVANLAEMKDGEYVITVDGQTKPIAEALEGINNKDQLDELIGKTEEKSMEDLAFEQLDIQKQMAASLAKMEGRAARGVASSKMMDDVISLAGQSLKTSTDVLTDKGALGPAAMRGVVDQGGEELMNVLNKLMKGDFNVAEDFTKLEDIIKNATSEQINLISGNIKDNEAKFKELGQYMPQSLKDIIKEQTGLEITGTQSVKPVETGEVPPSVGETKTDTTSKGVENKMDLNINVTAPPNLTQQQILEALSAQEIREKLYKIMEEMGVDFKKKK